MNLVSFIKFIATILITNSHFEILYPDSLKVLSTGGTLGNSLFFFISGYTLYFSNKDSFIKWITKRFLRIYFPVWIFSFVSCIVLNRWNIFDFIFPNYWFLRAILVFYILYYIVVKYLYNRLLLVFAVILIGYLVTYFTNYNQTWVIEITDNNTYLHWYYYFGIMLLGLHIAKRNIKIKHGKLKSLFFLSLCVFIYYESKFLMLKYNVFDLQFIVPIALFLICYYTYTLISELNFSLEWFNKTVQFISGLTLEIYIVQFIVIKSLYSILFPINAIMSVVVILISAFLLNFFATKLMNKISTKL